MSFLHLRPETREETPGSGSGHNLLAEAQPRGEPFPRLGDNPRKRDPHV